MRRISSQGKVHSGGTRTPSVKVLEKTLRILDLYAPGRERFSLEEVAKVTGYPKPTVFRILKTLERGGLLSFDTASGSYRLGLKLLELGGMVYESLSIRKAAASELDRLSQELKATLLLGIIRDDHLLYIDKRESHSLVRVSSYMGLKRPPHYGMLGMVLLAFMQESERERLLKAYPPQKYTPATVTDIKELLKRLEQARQLGYYLESGEVIEGVAGIGVPLRDFSGRVAAALGAAFLEFQLRDGGREKAVQELLRAAREISKGMGYVSPQ
jgi:IclR family KDG regulon transcriptional repressor